MAKKLPITVDDEVYAGLQTVIGRRRISRFLNDLVRPHVLRRELAEGYRAMVADALGVELAPQAASTRPPVVIADSARNSRRLRSVP